MNDTQLLLDLVGRRGPVWVTATLQTIVELMPETGFQAPTSERTIAEPISIEDRGFEMAGRGADRTVIRAADPLEQIPVATAGEGFVTHERPITHAEATAGHDNDLALGPGVQVDADGNVTFAPIAPLGGPEPTIDFAARGGFNDARMDGYGGADAGPST